MRYITLDAYMFSTDFTKILVLTMKNVFNGVIGYKKNPKSVVDFGFYKR